MFHFKIILNVSHHTFLEFCKLMLQPVYLLKEKIIVALDTNGMKRLETVQVSMSVI